MTDEVIKKRWGKWKRQNLAFWRRKFPAKVKAFNHSFPLHDYFGPMIGDKKEVWIADLGAGVVSTTGSTWPGVKVHVYPSDIWANEYLRFYMKAGIERFIPVEKQDMMNLSYSDNLFDIVHCTNALDHCIDPFKALKEMYRICDKGGWIYLRHRPNEGKKHRYTMQHQWNIEKRGSNCRFWNYQEEFWLSDCVRGFETVEKRELPNEPITIVSTLQK